MEFINGASKVLYIKLGQDYIPIGCLTENNISESASFIETTTRDNQEGWSTSIPVAQNYSIGFSGLMTAQEVEAGLYTYADLKFKKRNFLKIEWQTRDAFDNYDFGSGYISELSDAANIDEYVSFSGSITGYGILQTNQGTGPTT